MQYGSLSIGLALAACLGVSGCGEKRTLGEEPVPVEVRPGEWRMRRPAQLIALSAS